MAQRSENSMVSVALLLGALLASLPLGVQSIAVCYGLLGNNLPTPSSVVKLFKQNRFDAMRIYNPNIDVLNALRGSKISVMVDVANEDVCQIAEDPQAAVGWVRNFIIDFPDVSFKYIGVGNEIRGIDTHYILPAMENIYNALILAGLDSKIKVSTVIEFGVIGTSYPPSAGAFSSNSILYLGPIVQFLSNTGAPLFANVYPYFGYINNVDVIDVNYALFTSPGTVVTDGEYQYQNLFDAMVDVLHSALEKAGGDNVRVVVTETGWPSAGGLNATVQNAKTYVEKLISHVKTGTPRRPGALETYIFAMFNENEKPTGVEQNWGLYYPNEHPVYSVNFNGY
ncbi:glucan endo-1,3-beta-glucosidase-like [Carex rostrata]